MKIEHLGLQIEKPVEMAEWYCKNFGFTIKRDFKNSSQTLFIADNSGNVMLEIYNNQAVKTPDYANMDPLLMHLAFQCDDVNDTIKRLVADGATLIAGPDDSPYTDDLGMLRDPWGLAIQLCKRVKPMI